MKVDNRNTSFTDVRPRKHRLTAEQRAEFSRERRALVGKIISQEGFQGALVVEHIRGSQYLLRMPNGEEVFASHKKQSTLPNGALSHGGWKLWEVRR